MKVMDNYNSPIDLTAEQTACMAYFKQYWDISPLGDEHFSAMVGDILRAAHAMCGGFLHKYCGSDLRVISGSREDNIEKGLIHDSSVIGRFSKLGSEFAWYDCKVQLCREITLSCISTYVDRVMFTSPVYHLDVVELLVRRLRLRYPGVQSLRPFGYESFTTDYSDYQGQEELDIQAVRDEFKGHDVTTGRSFEFPVRLQLPHVAYDDICQGRSPDYVAVASFFTHFSDVIAHNNTVELMQEWQAIDWTGPVCFNDEFVVPEDGWVSKLWSFRFEHDTDIHRLT